MVFPWTIFHFDNDVNVTPLGEALPQNLEFGIYLNEPSYANYSLSVSHPLATSYTSKPMSTYVGLVGPSGAYIVGGLLVEIQIDSLETGLIGFSVKGWMEYYNRRHYPFDPNNIELFRYAVLQRDVMLVINDIFTTVNAEPGSPPLGLIGSLMGRLIDYRIEPGDTEVILNKFKTLSKEEPGFDITEYPEGALIFSSPRKGTLRDIRLEVGRNIQDMSFRDMGIVGTHVLGLASNSSSRAAALDGDDDIAREYIRLDAPKDFGNVQDQTVLDNLTAAEGARVRSPARPISCKYRFRPDEDPFTTLSVGDSYPVYGPIANYTIIDDVYRLIGIQCTVDDENEGEATLIFDDDSLSL